LLAIIGGSGLSQLANLEVSRRQIVRTPYGEASGPVTFGRIGGGEVAFLARHGYGHTLAPHEINYRANLWALREKGVTRILAVCTVGGIAPGLRAGALEPVVHVDFTRPYCEATRRMILESAAAAGVAVADGGTYAATQGPRLETAAEIDRLERDGAHLVGMTGMPEAALARELAIPYAALALVATPAAGRGASAQAVSMEEISRVMKETMGSVRQVVERMVERHGHP
jgi:purine nucleoside phosphorylase